MNGLLRFVGAIFFVIILVYAAIGIFAFFGVGVEVYIMYLTTFVVAVLLFGSLPQGAGEVFLPPKTK